MSGQFSYDRTRLSLYAVLRTAMARDGAGSGDDAGDAEQRDIEGQVISTGWQA